jgi:hypothetical protein
MRFCTPPTITRVNHSLPSLCLCSFQYSQVTCVVETRHRARA